MHSCPPWLRHWWTPPIQTSAVCCIRSSKQGIPFALQVLSTDRTGMSFNNDRMTAMTRKIRESPQEPLAPAVNLKTIPGLLMFINFCGVIYFLFMMLLIVAVSFSITLPALYSGVAFWTRMIIALFILFQVWRMQPVKVFVACYRSNRNDDFVSKGRDWSHSFSVPG